MCKIKEFPLARAETGSPPQPKDNIEFTAKKEVLDIIYNLAWEDTKAFLVLASRVPIEEIEPEIKEKLSNLGLIDENGSSLLCVRSVIKSTLSECPYGSQILMKA